jgi:hypothetical protein
VWAFVIAFAFFVVIPHLPIMLGIAGGLLGGIAGLLQHLSIKQNPDGFLSASSLMGVRRGLSNNRWGRAYIASVYMSKIALALLAFVLVKAPLYRILLGYLAAYVSFMLIRDVLTLRDTFALRRLGNGVLGAQ